MLPIGKSPLGLLELFSMKTLGRAPFQMAESIQPTIDVASFYAPNITLNSTSAPTVGDLLNLDDALTLSAPVRVKAIAGQLIIGAAGGTNLTWEVGIQIPGNFSTQCAIATGFTAAFAATQVIGFGAPLGWVCLPGVQVYCRASGTAAGVDHSLQLVAAIENLTGTV